MIARAWPLRNAETQVVFERPHPRADGATHLLLEPLELIEKLSVLILPVDFIR